MGISWAHLWHPLDPDVAKPSAQSLRAFDEAGGRHHEHQLGTFLATWPTQD